MGGIQKERPLTSEQAARITHGLKRVFDQGFISRDMYEALKRRVEGRISPTRG